MSSLGFSANVCDIGLDLLERFLDISEATIDDIDSLDDDVTLMDPSLICQKLEMRAGLLELLG
jgi:hypothetical protein